MDIKTRLKQALIEELKLEDLTPDDIDDDAPLFGDGLGLDSLDAIEMVVLIQRNFGLAMQDQDAAQEAFASINALVEYIEAGTA